MRLWSRRQRMDEEKKLFLLNDPIEENPHCLGPLAVTTETRFPRSSMTSRGLCDAWQVCGAIGLLGPSSVADRRGCEKMPQLSKQAR